VAQERDICWAVVKTIINYKFHELNYIADVTGLKVNGVYKLTFGAIAGEYDSVMIFPI
jgi:hypothetical protein